MKNSHSKTVYFIFIVLCAIIGFSACKMKMEDEAEPKDYDNKLMDEAQPAVCYQGKTYHVSGKPVDSLMKGYKEIGKVIGISSSEFPYNDFEANDIELDGKTMYYHEEKELIAIEWEGKYIEYGKPKIYYNK
ncbi:MAG: hypothetical protein GX271_11175 [Clostridiales bacterium]|nr:hypothetical protein [Clostridiales bacterium]